MDSTVNQSPCRQWLEKIPLSQLKGVGVKTLARLHEMGLVTVQDMLFHLPLRYEDRSRVVPITRLIVGQRSLIEGRVHGVSIVGGRRRFLQCQLSDSSGTVRLRFFHFNRSQYDALRVPDKEICCFGEVKSSIQGLSMIHPEYRSIEQADELKTHDTLCPVYPTTQGIKQALLRKLAKQVIALLQQPGCELDEGLPLSIQQQYQLPSLKEALVGLHFPDVGCKSDEENTALIKMRQRLVIEELLAHQLSVLRLRSSMRQQSAFCVDCFDRQSVLMQQLPFDLTSAQHKVLGEINRDMARSFPMLRLVQGDVGCGKTIVAALAALSVIDSGFQVAIMAPTELLAEQHFHNFKRWFEPLDIDVGWLPGKLINAVKQETLRKINVGEVKLVVGTHALIQQHVEFHQLGLMVIDEQHRFGVAQRLILKEKGERHGGSPHQLTMTATPIPRTLAMTAYGDMDYSVIDELPPGRQPVKTVLVSQEKRDLVIERVLKNCQTGQQAYWVCTLVEDSEVLQCQAAETTFVELQQRMPGLRVGLVHGRLPSDEKEAIMQQFASHQLDILVATTVIEVGVDVGNASLMVIENPERLGLAQLHQLRGRVGRGSTASFCVLLYQSPLSNNALTRLHIIRDHSDGFYIAQEDLLLRGPGELLGARQAGVARYRIADMVKDQVLIEQACQLAHELFEEMPAPHIKLLMDRWLGCWRDALQV